MAWSAGRVVVVPDGGGQGQDALHVRGERAGVPTVAFKFELAFEGAVDDSMIWRSGLERCAPAVRASPGGADAAGASQPVRGCSESRP